MPRIVDRVPDPAVVKRVVCHGCGVTVEYVPNDVKPLWRGKDISGGPDGADGFRCPGCKKDIIVERW